MIHASDVADSPQSERVSDSASDAATDSYQPDAQINATPSRGKACSDSPKEHFRDSLKGEPELLAIPAEPAPPAYSILDTQATNTGQSARVFICDGDGCNIVLLSLAALRNHRRSRSHRKPGAENPELKPHKRPNKDLPRTFPHSWPGCEGVFPSRPLMPSHHHQYHKHILDPTINHGRDHMSKPFLCAVEGCGARRALMPWIPAVSPKVPFLADVPRNFAHHNAASRISPSGGLTPGSRVIRHFLRCAVHTGAWILIRSA